MTTKRVIVETRGEQLTTGGGTQLVAGGMVDSSVWFSRRHTCRMFEETLLLTNWGRTLTFITLEHSRRYDD